MLNVLDHFDRFKPGNPLPEPIRKLLRKDGDGITTCIADYSGVNATEFYYECPDDRIALINELIVDVQQVGTWTVAKYGGISALTTGAKIQVREGESTVVHDLFDGAVVKTNADWQAHVHRLDYVQWSAATQSLKLLFNFAASGVPVLLRPGQRLTFVADDDFDGLDSHTFKATGYLYQRDGQLVQPPVP